MTALGYAALRQIALKVLAQYAGSAAGAQPPAAAARRAFDDLVQASSPLIGQVGVDALIGRAVHLAQREFPWLVSARELEQPNEGFAGVVACLEQQDPAIANEAAAALFATFTGLLVTLIGERLTTGLLQKAWPETVSNAGPAGDPSK